jgi:thiol:disulfide interchange protein
MMAAGVRKVNGEELEKELSEWGTPVLLDVFAQWCGT